jgi:hypothetical protein
MHRKAVGVTAVCSDLAKWKRKFLMVATPLYSGEVTKVVWPPLFSKYTTSKILLPILKGHCKQL